MQQLLSLETDTNVEMALKKLNSVLSFGQLKETRLLQWRMSEKNHGKFDKIRKIDKFARQTKTITSGE